MPPSSLGEPLRRGPVNEELEEAGLIPYLCFQSKMKGSRELQEQSSARLRRSGRVEERVFAVATMSSIWR